MHHSHHLPVIILIILITIVFSSLPFIFLKTVTAESINVSIEVLQPQCSDGIDNDGDLQTDYPNDPECVSDTDNNENIAGVETHGTSTIESTGGSFSFDNADNLSIDFSFPSGFHSKKTRVFANSYSNSFFESSKPASSGKLFVGKTYDFTLYSHSTKQKMSQTSKDIDVTLRYEDGDVGNVHESTLSPYLWSSTSSSWTALSSSTLDAANNKLIFSTATFGSFSILGTSVGQPECNDDIDNDGDGKVDYPSDPGCSSSSDNDETDEEEKKTPSGGGGGGGGGGTTTVTPATIIFKGHAYPESAVTILMDSKILDTITADSKAFWSGKFKVEPHSHTFGVYSADEKGRRSLTYTFSLSPSRGTTSIISGIFIAPTIDADKTQVRKGETIKFLGQTAPSSTVTLFVNSEETIEKQVEVSDSGFYFLDLDSGLLDYGNHSAKSRSTLNNTLSAISNSISFKVGTKSIIKRSPGDLNGDGRVNITDFSVLLFWWKGVSDRAFDAADINGDKQVDIRDLSIQLFYWTG